jgi:hypothetical protein
MDWEERAFSVTVVLVAASLCLVAAGLAGFGGSVGIAGVFVVLAGGLSSLRGRLSAAPVVVDHDTGAYAAVLWLAPLLAGGVSLLFLGATPSELQVLGGLLGLAGMGNYFLRPVYRAGYSLVRVVAPTTD